MVDARLVDFIGTDAHRTNHRSPKVSNGVKDIYKRFDKEYVDAICYKNAVKYLNVEE